MGLRDRAGKQGADENQQAPLSPEAAEALRLLGPGAVQLGLDVMNLPKQAAIDFTSGTLNRNGQFNRDQLLMMVYTVKSDALVAAAAQQGVHIDPAALMRTLIDSDRKGENPLQLAARLRRETGMPKKALDALTPLPGQILSPTEQFILRTQEAAKKTQEERETIRGRLSGAFRGIIEGFMKFLRSAFRFTMPDFLVRGLSNTAAATPAFAAAAGDIPAERTPAAASATPALGNAFRDNSSPSPVPEPQDGLRRIFHLAGLTLPGASAQRPLLQPAPQFVFGN